MQTPLTARPLACALVMGLMLPTGSDLRAQGLTGTGSMHAASGHYATLLEDRRVMVVGGVSIKSPCDSNATAETYDPVKGAWSRQKDEGAAPASGEIYKMELDGTIVGKLGRPVNGQGGFRTLYAMQCRQESEIIAAEFGFSVVIIKMRP
jgi:hypothetical protein